MTMSLRDAFGQFGAAFISGKVAPDETPPPAADVVEPAEQTAPPSNADAEVEATPINWDLRLTTAIDVLSRLSQLTEELNDSILTLKEFPPERLRELDSVNAGLMKRISRDTVAVLAMMMAVPQSYETLLEQLRATVRELEKAYNTCSSLPLQKNYTHLFEPAVIARTIVRESNKAHIISSFFSEVPPPLRASTLRALVEVGGLDVLRGFLEEDSDGKRYLGIQGFEALEDRGHIQTLEPTVLKLIGTESKAAALTALERRGTEVSVPLLVELLNTSQPEGSEIAKALSQIVDRDHTAARALVTTCYQLKPEKLSCLQAVAKMLSNKQSLYEIIFFVGRDLQKESTQVYELIQGLALHQALELDDVFLALGKKWRDSPVEYPWDLLRTVYTSSQ